MTEHLDLTHPSHIDYEITGIKLRPAMPGDHYELEAFFKYRSTVAELRTQDVVALRDFLNGLILD